MKTRNYFQSFAYPSEMISPTVRKLDGSSCAWKPRPVPILTLFGVQDGFEEMLQVFHDNGRVTMDARYDGGHGSVYYTPTDEDREALARAIWPEGFQ